MSFANLWKYMKFDISKIFLQLFVICFFGSGPLLVSAAEGFDEILKDVVAKNGFSRASDLASPLNTDLSAVGEQFFASKNLANNRDVACQDCHLDNFSSADGLPIAIGVNGQGSGLERIFSDGEIIPRNTLPLWGRGQKNFNTFFWDGRVEMSSPGELRSQFGLSAPSSDPLTVAVHLPLVEIKEMLVETKEVKTNKLESAAAAGNVFDYILDNLRTWEPALISDLAQVYGVESSSLTFNHVAESLSGFIRSKFAIKETKFHEYIFANGKLTEKEKSGALLFYGKAKCSVCHAGPYLSDFKYHAIAFPQLGSGKNGFGIDYGRFNVTHNPQDLYKFRTPPLFNVGKTPPYGHSGSVNDLEDVIRFHFDPLQDIAHIESMSSLERTEYYKVLSSANEALLLIPFLDSGEITEIVSFLETLSF